MDAQLCEKKNVSQCNGTRILPGKCQSTVRVFLTVHYGMSSVAILYVEINVLYIEIFMG